MTPKRKVVIARFCFYVKKAISELAFSATAMFLLALLKRRIPLNP
jgi:hypothetical protein